MNQVINLSEGHSIVSHYLSEIRDATIQNDRLRFRRNMERCGELLAYEISKQLEYVTQEVKTPLAPARVKVLKEQPVLAAILRAGLILHQGLLNIFDHADCAFVSAYRKHHSDDSFEIALEYLGCPPLNDRILILADPMLATGRSMVRTLHEIYALAQPKQTHLACVISAREGLVRVLDEVPEITIWTCAVDEELNAKSYIVPGLGDAGDLSYGEKIQR